jgi:two-component system CheB/CheR fusion protein
LTEENRSLFIIGIGASAGGLAALEQFFDHMPAESGMAFVVIQHFSTDFKSQMENLLSRHTSMPIQKVADNITILPNNIYLNVSMTQMEVKNGNLLLTQISKDRQGEQPIDIFFTSLSKQVGARAVGVILSGTGKDGSEGVRAIHTKGGLVVVQHPETAEFATMPQSAIDNGACDFVLPPAEIPAVLLQHLANPGGVPTDTPQEVEPPEDPGEYQQIFDLLQREHHLDFAIYKTGTVGRRIKRRMGYRHLEGIAEYASTLALDPNELDELYHDLLIGVTEFFRDDRPFQYLESTIIPELFGHLPAGQDMRAWSAGCATGEEAYSLAILLMEKACELKFTGKISVFATVVHKRSLDFASQGLFTSDSLAKLSPKRRERFFVEVDKNLYKVKNELRKLLTFVHHDLTKDIPLYKLNLICCRNLLIYLQPEAQKKVLSLFHFALNMHGILFLGKSEDVGSRAGNFELLSIQNKIFSKVREQELPVALGANRNGSTQLLSGTTSQPGLQRPVCRDRQVLTDYDILLERHCSPGMLLDEKFHIICFFGEVSQFLKTLKGRIDSDILSMTEEHLHVALSTSLQKARITRQRTITRNIRIKSAQGEYLVDATVDPILHEKSNTLHYHIYFQHIQKEQMPPDAPGEAEPDSFEPNLFYRQHLADLELELQSTRAELLATRENLHSTSEALNATKEKLQAANEELNSTNEKLYSTNDKIYSVNTEF